MFSRATITLGIGPRSSVYFYPSTHSLTIHFFTALRSLQYVDVPLRNYSVTDSDTYSSYGDSSFGVAGLIWLPSSLQQDICYEQFKQLLKHFHLGVS